jgi:aspartokinase/homoserine dehydrogenase 1
MSKASETLNLIVQEQIEIVRQIATPAHAANVEARIAADSKDIINVVRAVGLLKTIPPATMELVTGYGEVWSAMTMHAYLDTLDVPSAWLDAREVLVVEQTSFGLGDKGSANVVGVDPLWEITAERVGEWFKAPGRADLLSADCAKTAPIVVVTGFVAATLEGTPTTLKRSGSDFSATIFARLMGASKITMWKNVDGVYTADPRRVPEAFPIKSLKYDEAIELAYFGAQVLHPSAMLPCIQGKIPIYVRNIFNPEHPGTVIEGRACALDEAAAADVRIAEARGVGPAAVDALPALLGVPCSIKEFVFLRTSVWLGLAMSWSANFFGCRSRPFVNPSSDLARWPWN